MIPKFFKVTPNGSVGASVRQIKRIGSDPCARCCRLREEYHGPIEIEVHGGTVWPDILPTAHVSLLSARVRAALERLGVEMEGDSVEIVTQGKSLPKPAPSYVHLRIPAGLDIDIGASNCPRLTVCPLCGATLDGSLDCERLVPIETSWNRKAFFTLRNPRRSDYYCCTVELLEIARAEEWMGFHFSALDVPQGLMKASGHRGIDYLGKEWPPKSWYPPRLGEGKSQREWLRIYNTTKSGPQWYEAWRALLDLGQKIVPAVLRQFEEEDEQARLRAARLLVALEGKTGVAIPADVSRQARDLWPDPSVVPERLA